MNSRMDRSLLRKTANGGEPFPTQRQLTVAFWCVFGCCAITAAFDFVILIAPLTRGDALGLGPIAITFSVIRFLLFAVSPFLSRWLGVGFLGMYLLLFADFVLRNTD